MLVDNIVKQENSFVVAIDELKSDIPVVLLGAGIIAKRLTDFLNSKGIEIAAYIVHQDYYKPGLKIGEHQVYDAETFFAETAKSCNLIVAHNGFREDTIEKYKDKIEKVYLYDFCGMFTMGPLNVITQKFITENMEKLNWLDENLSDERSKKEITTYINQKISGTYRTDFDENQYFSSDIIKLSDNEIFVDCGAFTGDSISSFLKNLEESEVHTYHSIYAFEPDQNNCELLRKNLSDIHDLHVVEGGAWNENGTLSFDTEANTGSKISESGSSSIRVYTIDSVLKGEKATFIKMDIEGAEMNALLGAKETILKYKPTLAICVYHRNEDIFEIPQYIKSLVPEYKLYYRKHAETATEMVLYAVI